MKKPCKYVVAIIVLVILAVIGNWPGSGTKDEWDNLKKWAKEGKTHQK